MQKPIEPGCLVMVMDATDSSYIGLTGIAVRVAYGSSHPGIYWELDTSDLCHNQKCLMRIDGGDPDALQVESQDQEADCHAIA